MVTLGDIIRDPRPGKAKAYVICSDSQYESVDTEIPKTKDSLLNMTRPFREAIRFMTPTQIIDGWNLNETFPYHTVTAQTQVVYTETSYRRFSFVEAAKKMHQDFIVNRLNRRALTIKQEELPNFVYSIDANLGIEATHCSRQFILDNFTFLTYSNEADRQFYQMPNFGSWNEFQWLLFDNFMCECIQLSLLFEKQSKLKPQILR